MKNCCCLLGLVLLCAGVFTMGCTIDPMQSAYDNCRKFLREDLKNAREEGVYSYSSPEYSSCMRQARIRELFRE